MISSITLSDRNQVVVAYMPQAQRIARAFWSQHVRSRGGNVYSTQKRNSDTISYEELESAAYRALVQARDGWDPLRPNCGVAGCILPSENGKYPTGINSVADIKADVHGASCEHGNIGYTFGAYAKRFIEGACIATLKRSGRRKPIPYAEELMPVQVVRDAHERPDSRAQEYERLPDYHPLQDGSEFDGSPGGALWASCDLTGLRSMIDAAIEAGEASVRGLSPGQLRVIVEGMSNGIAHAEIASKACCKIKAVQDATQMLKDLLSDTDFAEEDDLKRSLSLSELAAAVTCKYPHDPCKAKRMGEWLARGWVPGKQTPEGRWVISHWAAQIAIKRWGERNTRKESKDLDSDSTSDKVLDMKAKPARVLRVIGHTATALPEYGNAAIGPIVSIEVGQGRAHSCAVTSHGDRFYSRNRELVLQRFGLTQDGEIVRPVGLAVPMSVAAG